MAEILDSIDLVEMLNQITKSINSAPTLTLISVDSNDKEAELYANMLRKHGAELGINVSYICNSYWSNRYYTGSTGSTKNILLSLGIQSAGIIILQPHKASKLLNELNSLVDVDCLTFSKRQDIFMTQYPTQGMLPAVVESIIYLINKSLGEPEEDYAGKKIVVINRSQNIGRPLEQYLLSKNATVTMCHSKTPLEILEEETNRADIVVTAMGQPHMLTTEYFYGYNDQEITVIDAGTSYDEKGKLCGDVHPNVYEWCDNVKYTPVTNGVGALTTAILLNRVAQLG